MSHPIEKTAIWGDIRSVLNSSEAVPKYIYIATIHTVKEDYNVLKVESMDIERNYRDNIGDHIQIDLVLTMGDYISRFYPFKDNIELTITRTPQGKAGSKQIQRYKAVFKVNENMNPANSDITSRDQATLNILEPVHVKLQLLNRSLETVRIKTTSGVFKKVNPGTLLRSVIGAETNKIKIDGRPAIDSVDIYEPDNKEDRDQLIIPNNTPILDLPTFLQEKMHGVYSGAIGTYIQNYKNKQVLFVYPLFNTERFKKTKDTMIFYSLPKDRFESLDRTYQTSGPVVKVLVTSDKNYMDSGEAGLMNDGVGFRQSDSRSFMGKPVMMTADGPVGNPARVNALVANKNRADGLNYAPNSSTPISSNYFAQYSQIMAKSVSKIDLMWQNADPNLIYPGMPCQYVFLNNNNRVTLNGIIIYVHAFVQSSGGLTNTLHNCSCFISIAGEINKTPTSAPAISSVQLPGKRS